MSELQIDGPRTFVRVSDENGNLIAYIGGSSLEEANRLAQDLIHIEKFRQEAREIYQQGHDQQYTSIDVAVDFIGRVAGVEEGWSPTPSWDKPDEEEEKDCEECGVPYEVIHKRTCSHWDPKDDPED